MFKHQLRWALAAYALGAVALVGALLLRSLSLSMAAALFLLGVAMGAKATMRCPFCQRSVANELIPWPWVWRSHVPKACPHCGTNLDSDM